MTLATARSDCPVSSALDIWGDKWSLLIVRDLLYFAKNSYSDFLQSDEKISTNILADRLQTLEKSGVIVKRSLAKSKIKGLYQLTPKGIALLPMMLEISLWFEQFSQVPEAIAQMLAVVKANKAAFIAQKTQELLAFYQQYETANESAPVSSSCNLALK